MIFFRYLAYILAVLVLGSNLVFSQQTYRVGKSPTESATDIVTKELKDIGLKRIAELVKIAKSGKRDLLNQQFSSRNYITNPNNEDDKAEYAVIDDSPTDEEISQERIDFFKNLEKDCGKKNKVRVGYMENENEPIGHSFRLTIPAKKIGKGAMSCNHYTVSFRRALDGQLLVTEWFAMPGNTDC